MDFGLKRRLSQISVNFIKTKVNSLKTECDEAVEKDLGSRIRTLLEEVDTLRAKFNGTKSNLIEELQGTLKSLGSNDESINQALSDIDSICPTWLSVLPETSVFANRRPPTPAMSPQQEQEQEDDVGTSGVPNFAPSNERDAGNHLALLTAANEGADDDQDHQNTRSKHPREDPEADASARKKSRTSDRMVGYFSWIAQLCRVGS